MSQHRMHLGKAHERRVARSLECRGWHVAPWGQGILSDEVRQAFIERDAGTDLLLWRWLPDLIAVKGPGIFLVEAKSEAEQSRDTPNFSIECRCIVAQLAMRQLGLQTVIVWANGTCNTPENLRVVDYRLPSGKGRRVVDANGSGTPFALVRKDEQLAIETFFGDRVQGEAA